MTHDASFRYLVHGNTVHGEQRLTGTPSARREPLTYYHRRGPFGSFHAVFQGDPRLDRVALVGLGTGALASHAESGQRWTFFEIDPHGLEALRSGWKRVAADPAYPLWTDDLSNVFRVLRLTADPAGD